MITSELAYTAQLVNSADSYLAVFGPCSDNASQGEHIKRIYRRLATVLHPDRYSTDEDKAVATKAFGKLGDWLRQAEQVIVDGTYGQQPVLMSVMTKAASHEIVRLYAEGDVCQLLRGRMTKGSREVPAIYKVPLRAQDNDLIRAEVRALRRLSDDVDAQKFQPFFPELLDGFTYTEKSRGRCDVNVLAPLDGFFSLEQVIAAYPGGIDQRDMVWIWRRLLHVLGYVHQKGVIHGAVLPPHVMIHPEAHGLVLVDWCYSSHSTDEIFQPLTAIVRRYHDWYPVEVLRKEQPSPATDIVMAARTMVQLCGGDPKLGYMPLSVKKQFRAFFRGCLAENQNARPQNAHELLVEFDELIESMGPPFYPRRFHTFTMPTGMV